MARPALISRAQWQRSAASLTETDFIAICAAIEA